MPNEPQTIDVNAALVQLLESWQRAGVQDTVIPDATVVQELAKNLQAVGKSSSANSAATPQSRTGTTFPKRPTPPLQAPIANPQPVRPTHSSSSPASTPTPIEPMAKRAKPSLSSAPTHSTMNEPPSLFESPDSLTSSPIVPVAERPAMLQIIRDEVAPCTRCTELAETRTQTVFGVGDPNAQLCFVGEAPGADEDKKGEPFVGRAGQLLTKIIEACKLTREEVYIANVLKCRPPSNRTPLPPEVANCRGFLDRQLEIIRPEVIVCLGAVASQCLLNTELSVGKLRHKWHNYRGIKVYCTYHPAYLLRNPNAKKDVWEDMKVVMQKLGVTL